VTKRYLGQLWKYLLGLGLVGYLIWSNWSVPGEDSSLSAALSRPPQWLPLVLAAAAYLAGLLVTFYRWYLLVRAQDLPFTLPNALRLGSVGFFLSTVLPGSIGGDIVKTAFLAREQSRRAVAIATVLLDRAIGLWGLIWLVALAGGVFWAAGNPALASDRRLQTTIVSAAALVGGTVVLWLLLGVLPAWRAEKFARRLGRIPKVGHSLAEFWRALWMYRCQGRSVAGALGLSMVSHVCFTLSLYCSAQIFLDAALPARIPSLAEHFLIVPVGSACQALFPTPGGAGASEGLYPWFYKLLGASWTNGLLAALCQRGIVVGWAIVACFVFLGMRPAIKAVAFETEERLAA
jgi:glycosyltransferase 2 family protein